MIFVTGIHGNEQVPVFCLLKKNVPQIIGNIKALTKGLRYIDKDLNASFGLTGKSYEIIRASEILRKIPKDEIVVDFHTYLQNPNLSL